MTWVFVVIPLLVSVGAVAGIMVLGKRLPGGVSVDSLSQLLEEAKALEDTLKELTALGGNVASKAQLEGVSAQTQEYVNSLEAQKGLLKEIETRLEQAQRDVETKESAQQEMKSAKEEDEVRLQELMGQFDDVSSQSVSLEQQLAASLKELDILMADVPMTADQKAVFQELSNALTAAGSRLRDLITDYQAVQERLENLKLQHTDLEDEYTKLVEQQLGA